jgi:hypothetical protein
MGMQTHLQHGLVFAAEEDREEDATENYSAAFK